MVKDSCHKNFSWVWSRSKAAEFKRSCNEATECINLSVKGYIYTREECRNIVHSFYNYLVKNITTYKDLSLITSEKDKYFSENLNRWSHLLLTKYEANVNEKLTPKLEKKLEKAAKELRKLYLDGIENLDLTRISNIKLKKIADNTKNLNYRSLVDEKNNQLIEKKEEELQRQRFINRRETGYSETDKQRYYRENLLKTINAVKK